MPKIVYDVEDLLDDIQAFVKANLNTIIDEINSEKDDGIDLKHVDNDAYFMQELNSKQANYNPFILFGVSNIETISNGYDAAANISIEVILIFEDTNGLEANIPRLAFRYNRALRDVIRNNWSQRVQAGKLVMEDLLPVPYTSLNNSKKTRATGVKIITSIA
mgnify:CR=1 FL=1